MQIFLFQVCFGLYLINYSLFPDSHLQGIKWIPESRKSTYGSLVYNSQTPTIHTTNDQICLFSTIFLLT